MRVRATYGAFKRRSVDPPVNTAAPVVTGTPGIGETLSSTNGTWTNSPTSFDYEWTRDGTPIGGATASTYNQVAADIGLEVRCEVTANNSGGASAPEPSNAIIYEWSTPGGLVAHYRADSYASGTWTDLSGGGHDLTQATAGNRGTQVSRWGRQAVSLDGGDFSQGALGASQAQPYTIYGVFEFATSFATERRVWDGDDTSNNPQLSSNATPAWRFFAGTALTGGTPALDTLYGACAVHDATGLLFVNNFLSASPVISAAEGARAIDGVTLGASAAGTVGMIGFIGEYALFSGAHSEATRKNIGALLNNYYTGMAIVIA